MRPHKIHRKGAVSLNVDFAMPLHIIIAENIGL